jgi:uncharacterized protein YjbJ (UPF0337 family)
MLMTDDRMAGTWRNAPGTAQEGFGKTTGETRSETKGVMDQAAVAVQDAYGKTMDAASEGAQIVKEAAIQGHDTVRRLVENNPYSAIAIALGIGLIIGYAAHREPQRRYWWD